jgi:hypothetical protein
MIQVMLAVVKTRKQDQAGQVHLGKLKAPSQLVGISRTLTHVVESVAEVPSTGSKLALSDMNQEYSAHQTTSSPSLNGGQRNGRLAPSTKQTAFPVSP